MPQSLGYGAKPFVMVCLLSLTVHLALFAGVFLFHDFDFLPSKPKVVRVDLVSFAPGPVGGQTKPEPIQENKSEPAKDSVNLNSKSVPEVTKAPKPLPLLKPDVSLKSKPKNIKELMAARKPKAKSLEKKKTQKLKPKPKKNPEKELEKARQALAQKVEDQTRKQIDQALRKMQAAIENKDNQSPKGPGAAPGSGSGAGIKGNNPLTLYQMVLKSAIEQNWVFNDLMARMNQNLEVKVFIKILKSGEIRDISYETRSGNQYLDESAKKAIRRASPLPELPKGMASYEVVVGFTPKGLK